MSGVNAGNMMPAGATRSQKKARTGRAESIFLEEDRGDDSDYPDPAAVNPIAISDIDHTNPE
jgi:hypothetical protein